MHLNLACFKTRRKKPLLKLIANTDPDIICAQEFSPDVDFRSSFEKTYNLIGNFTAIAYRKNYELIETYVNDLIPKRCICVLLKDKNDKKFVVMSCHLAWQNLKDDTKRVKEVRSCLNLLHENGLYKYPIFFCGDFNCEPKSEPITIVKTVFDDSFYKNQEPLINENTWNGYQDEDNHYRIDYIFSHNFEIDNFKILNEKVDGIIPSDHYPLWVKTK
jgi:endonuclease/exonuclease/phosphatase family metal-dependent hydrolase